MLLFFPSGFVCLFVCLFSPKSVHKPEKVCWAEAAGTVRDGLRAYTALHYLSQASPGKTVLVMDGASVGNNCQIVTISEQKDYLCYKCLITGTVGFLTTYWLYQALYFTPGSTLNWMD